MLTRSHYRMPVFYRAKLIGAHPISQSPENYLGVDRRGHKHWIHRQQFTVENWVKPEDLKEVNRSRRKLLPLEKYDKVIVSFSGGKDSIATVLHLLDLGVPKEKIELWHQCVDGAPGSPSFMDWPCTEAYCKAFAKQMGLTLRFQWRVGGFEREMLRHEEMGQDIEMQFDEVVVRAPTLKGKIATRMRFPAKSPNLMIRWCSAMLKIDVAAKAITWDSTLKQGKFLYLSGERREESPNRAKYAEVEAHRTDTEKRRMDHWRPVLNWSEDQVWALMRQHGVDPHPAYKLGWNRLSCMACIFGDKHQWATVRELAPKVFAKIAAYEKQFKRNIDAYGMNPDGTPKKAGKSVEELAAEGTAYLPEKGPELDALMVRALSREPFGDLEVAPDAWKLPFGAFTGGGGSGPT